jgi:hypothetical protein
VDNHIVQATYLANPTIADSVAATKEFKSLLPLWVVGFLHFIFNREDSDLCVEFFHAFAESRYSPDGIQDSTDPVWKFRQWLVKTADVEKDNRQRSYHAVYTGINAWNERAAGFEVSDYRKLAYKVGEPVPYLI